METWRPNAVTSESQPSAGHSADDSAEQLRFERRAFDRWPASGVADVYHMGGTHFGEAVAIKLIDYSNEGLGGCTQQPIDPGSTVSIGYRAPGTPAQQGVVTRCLPVGDGYCVAIQFQLRQAA